MNAMLALIAVIAYVMGIFPSAPLVGRIVGHDPTREGSRNPGATNMYRIAGRNAGAIVLALDFLKGFFATWLGLVVDDRTGALVAAVAVVIGHVFPLGRNFRGGKGVATFAGAAAVLWPLISFLALLIWLAVVRLSKVSALGALIAVPALVAGVVIAGRPSIEVIVAAALAILIIARHQSNIRGLLSRSKGVDANTN